MLTFEGCNFFRQRLVLSTLSGKAIRIVRIRDKDEQPGLTGRYPRECTCVTMYWALPPPTYQSLACKTNGFFFTEFEANFLKLLDILTDGSRIEVNESGNTLYE